MFQLWHEQKITREGGKEKGYEKKALAKQQKWLNPSLELHLDEEERARGVQHHQGQERDLAKL